MHHRPPRFPGLRSAEDKWSELPKLPVKTSAYHGCVLDGQLNLFGDYEELTARTSAITKRRNGRGSTSATSRPGMRPCAIGQDIFVVGGNVPIHQPLSAASSASQQNNWPTPPVKSESRCENGGRVETSSHARRFPLAVSASRCLQQPDPAAGSTLRLHPAHPIPPDTRFFRLKMEAGTR
jgi:hypothetical protein